MEIVLGLDFGTHQTKLCLKYRPSNVDVVEFVEFSEKGGEKTLLFPSVVQINEDDTMSIGFVNKNKCKKIQNKQYPPCPTYPSEPVIDDLPKEPTKTIIPKPIGKKKESIDWKQQLAGLNITEENKSVSKKEYPLSQWKKEQEESDKKYKIDHRIWEEQCNKIKNAFLERRNEWQSKKDKMEEDYKIECDKIDRDNPTYEQYYRYFKLRSFTEEEEYNINKLIDPKTCSIIYLTYLLLYVKQYVFTELNEKFEDSVEIHMGIPTGINSKEYGNKKDIGLFLLATSRKLMDYFDSTEVLCSSRYEDIKKRIDEIATYKEIKKFAEDHSLYCIPEAYAGLQSLTSKRQLSRGNMHLLVDIGGGTTDVAFFTINREYLPNVHCVMSFDKGLNYVFEEYYKHYPDFPIYYVQDILLEDLKKSSNLNWIEKEISMYRNYLEPEIKKMIQNILKESIDANLNKSAVLDAMKRRPIIYCGGGSIPQGMAITLRDYFNDVKMLDEQNLKIQNLKNHINDHHIYTILATAYGLSLDFQLSEQTGKYIEHRMTNINELFEDISPNNDDVSDKIKYEHGLTET